MQPQSRLCFCDNIKNLDDANLNHFFLKKKLARKCVSGTSILYLKQRKETEKSFQLISRLKYLTNILSKFKSAMFNTINNQFLVKTVNIRTHEIVGTMMILNKFTASPNQIHTSFSSQMLSRQLPYEMLTAHDEIIISMSFFYLYCPSLQEVPQLSR